jgi:ATP synthase protein I
VFACDIRTGERCGGSDHHGMTRRPRPKLGRLLVGQASVVLLMALVGLVDGQKAAVSAMSGGLVGLLPNLYFVWRIAPMRGGRQARRFVTGLYRAEAGKFGLTVALFALVFVAAPPSNPAFFFGAYVAVHVVHWLAPWLLRD